MHKDWKVAEAMAQARWAPKEVAARLLDGRKSKGGKNLGKRNRSCFTVEGEPNDSLKTQSPQWEEKWALLRTRFIRRWEAPCHCMWQRSGVTTTSGRSRPQWLIHSHTRQSRRRTPSPMSLERPSLIMAVNMLTYRSRDIAKKRVNRGGPTTQNGERSCDRVWNRGQVATGGAGC